MDDTTRAVRMRVYPRWWLRGHARRPYGGILCVPETPEQLRGLEKKPPERAVQKAVSNEWVKHQIWADYPFEDCCSCFLSQRAEISGA